jgi:hypothetical protein
LGAIAQLGERNTGSVEVGGSIPPGSTRLLERRLPKDSEDLASRTMRPHRLVGLGHRPFTAATGVRIPLGTPLQSKTYSYVGLFLCLFVTYLLPIDLDSSLIAWAKKEI